MRRIISIFGRDLSSSIRDNLLLYAMLAPILLALGLRLFIPGAQSASLQFALMEDTESAVIEEFERYGSVQLYETMDQLTDRVNDMDDVAGIAGDTNGGFRIILEGNEGHDTRMIPHRILRDMLEETKYPVDFETSEIGVFRSPTASYGAIMLALTCIMLGGMVIGFNIIEEKENGTLKALAVSPMTGLEFVAGRSIIGIVLPVIQIYIMLWILDITDVDMLMVFAATLAGTFTGVLVGFIIGVISSNQIAGIANLKAVFIFVLVPPIASLILPQGKHYLLYWAPTYWSFTAFRGVVFKTATWEQMGVFIAGMIVTTALAFVLMKSRVKGGLT
jgi:ABC-2 type transport system permease protein